MNKKKIIVGLAGNPNSGKTSIFNAITGSHQHVGNWPGVTVERKEGVVSHRGYKVFFIDLPGTYSLAPYTPEERVTRHFLTEGNADVVVDILDSTNLDRNLYFATQLMELECPLIFALNMFDEALNNGIKIDVDYLSKLFGIPLIPTCAVKSEGIDKLLDSVVDMYEGKVHDEQKKLFYGQELEDEIKVVEDFLSKDKELDKKYHLKWLAIKLLEEDKEAYKIVHDNVMLLGLDHVIRTSVKKLIDHYEKNPEVVVAESRYAFIHGAVKETVKYREQTARTFTERLDDILLHRFFGLPIFFVLIWIVFQLTFIVGEIPMGWIELFFSKTADISNLLIPSGIFRSVVVDGIIAGVGGVIAFIPNILILFLAISFMENSGYMARVAFLMDRFMHKVGLHGRSFIPMIMGFGCSVPAFMACRTLKNKNDQMTTMLVIPFMSCGAKLPVYILLASAFFSAKIAGNILFAIYIFGFLIGIIASRFLKSTILSGSTEPFVMELPPYRMPTLKNSLLHMWEKAWLFIKKAGTIILLASIVVWYLLHFPVNTDSKMEYLNQTNVIQENVMLQNFEKIELQNKLDLKYNREIITNSYAGKMGRLMEPAIKPLGFDWRIGISLVAGFTAKEVVVATLATIFSSESDGKDISIKRALKEDPMFSPIAALSLMIFVLLYAPCLSANIIFWKETMSLKWTLFMIIYTTSVAYVMALLVYQIGIRI